jgi:anti-anti-sigma factor
MVGGTVDLERECGVWVVTLRGEHDLSTAPQLRNSLARSFSSGWTVIIDMSEAEFIDSTTLNVLIGARRQRHPIALVAPSDTVAGRLVALVCLDDAIPTYQTRAEALDDLAPKEEVAAAAGRTPAVTPLPTRLARRRPWSSMSRKNAT